MVLAAAIAAAALACWTPARVHAGGLEYSGPGTRALGRGGAFGARSDDPLAVWYDPAGLAAIAGPQLLLNVNVAFFDTCMTRAGSAADINRLNFMFENADQTRFGTVNAIDDPQATYLGGPFPQVCNEGPPSPGGTTLLFGMPLGKGLGIGAGLLTPPGAGHLVWGNDDGSTTGASGQLVPSPTRYQLVEAQALLVQPAISIGWAPIPQLSVGLTGIWGIGTFSLRNYVVAIPGENPEDDILAELSLSDLFIPAAILSVHVVPHDNLDVVARFKWQDAINAGGDMNLRFGDYSMGAPDGRVPTETLVNDINFHAPSPWELGLAVRYGHRIAPRPIDVQSVQRLSGRIEDSMSNEWFDVELDFVWEMNSRVDQFTVTTPPNQALTDHTFDGGMEMMGTLPLPTRIPLPHHWKDQFILRFGGDFNVIPGLLALRAGVSYETSGLDPAYLNLDFIPGGRVGLHGGLTVRLGRFDISAAYAHIFQETVEVAEDASQLRQVEPQDMGLFVGGGKLEANWDIVSLGANYHF